ncbi:MAG: hypothetical protein ACLSVD_00810 [Eggerthellaceae bacterium]
MRCDGWSSENTGWECSCRYADRRGDLRRATRVRGVGRADRLPRRGFVRDRPAAPVAHVARRHRARRRRCGRARLRRGLFRSRRSRDRVRGDRRARPVEDELRAVADCSFVFEDDANAAFERALERKSGEADHEA